MSSLKEFLAEQSERLKADPSAATRRRDEWVSAVERLVDSITGWLRLADPESVLTLRREPLELREQGIGTYQINRLLIVLGPRIVRLEPVARAVASPLADTGMIRVIRAFGRVDLTDGLSRFYLYRTQIEPDERWSLVEQDSARMQALTRETFENALQALLE